ncbi:MAG: hypothetical protein KDH20_08865 [Rhodocyclaceae bacterium]|nr:hypothetical protein [Rhodocyclaceae bacterium]
MTSFRTLLPLSLFVICLGADAQDAPGSDLVRSPIRASIGEDARADRDWHVAWLHDTREHLRDFFEGVGRTVDGWFGDEQHDEGRRLVNGRLILNGLWRRDDGIQTGVNFRGKFDLPNLENKAYLYFGQDNERELITDQPDEFSRHQRLLADDDDEDRAFFAGLGYAIRENIDLRGGIKGGLKPYVQARYQRKWYPASSDEIEFRETLFWQTSEGVGLTTTLNYRHIFTDQVDFRWRNSATVSQSTDALAWQSSAGTYVRFGLQRQVSLEALIRGETGSTLPVAEYGVRAIYRTALYEDWLLGEFIVGHFWPRDEDDAERDRSWAAGMGIEINF